MTLKEYQTKAGTYGEYESKLYPALGLAEEAGEAVGKIAKYVRKNGGINNGSKYEKDQLRTDVANELGDVMWNVAEICNILGIDLEYVIEHNIKKLDSRKKRGVIQGNGDYR